MQRINWLKKYIPWKYEEIYFHVIDIFFQLKFRGTTQLYTYICCYYYAQKQAVDRRNFSLFQEQ